MILKIQISAIAWDFSDTQHPPKFKLPTKLLVEVDDECINMTDNEELEEHISDKLAETYGYCHNGFRYKVLN